MAQKNKKKHNDKMNTDLHYRQTNQEPQPTSQDAHIPETDQPNADKPNIWTKVEKFITSHHSICFCFVLLLIIILFGIYLWKSNENLKTSQQKIIECYNIVQQQTTSSVISYINQSAEHRKNLQSCVDRQIICLSNALGQQDSLLKGEDIFIKLYADIEYMKGQNEYITKVATDSLSLKYRELSSTITSEKMLELHLDKIEHEYTNITIWAAVLTIIFLIFSFFSLFKIEQSRKEIEEIRDSGHFELNKSVENMSKIYNQFTSKCEGEINSYKVQITDSYKTQFEELLNQYNSIIEAIKNKENK